MVLFDPVITWSSTDLRLIRVVPRIHWSIFAVKHMFAHAAVCIFTPDKLYLDPKPLD